MQSYNILAYGADPTGDSLSTDAIQTAIEICAASGGGEVIIPEGTFLTGDVLLRDNVTLYLLSGATLIGSRDPMEYFHYRKLYPLPAELIDDEPWKRQSIEKDSNVRIRIVTPGARWNNAIIRGLYAKNIAVIGDEGSVINGNDTYDEIGEEYYRGPTA